MIYIYSYQGRVWAGFSVPRTAKKMKSISVANEKECKRVIKKPGKIIPDRVAALAERALSELTPKDSLGRRLKQAWRVLRGYD